MPGDSIDSAVRGWVGRDRAAWWAKYLLALGAGLAGVRTADEAIAWYLARSGVQTVEASRAEHAEIVERIEAKIDKLGTRIDALLQAQVERRQERRR